MPSNLSDILLALLLVAVVLYVGIAIHMRFDLRDRRDAKITWSNPPASPYPTRSFSLPASKGFDRSAHVHDAVKSVVKPGLTVGESIDRYHASQPKRIA